MVISVEKGKEKPGIICAIRTSKLSINKIPSRINLDLVSIIVFAFNLIKFY